MANQPQCVLTRDQTIDGVFIAAGEVVGHQGEDGVIVATAEGVTRGHIEARLMSGAIKIIREGDASKTADPGAVEKKATAKRTPTKMVKPHKIKQPSGGVMDGGQTG